MYKIYCCTFCRDTGTKKYDLRRQFIQRGRIEEKKQKLKEPRTGGLSAGCRHFLDKLINI
jgi:hypothetical protein